MKALDEGLVVLGAGGGVGGLSPATALRALGMGILKKIIEERAPSLVSSISSRRSAV